MVDTSHYILSYHIVIAPDGLLHKSPRIHVANQSYRRNISLAKFTHVECYTTFDWIRPICEEGQEEIAVLSCWTTRMPIQEEIHTGTLNRPVFPCWCLSLQQLSAVLENTYRPVAAQIDIGIGQSIFQAQRIAGPSCKLLNPSLDRPSLLAARPIVDRDRLKRNLFEIVRTRLRKRLGRRHFQ